MRRGPCRPGTPGEPPAPQRSRASSRSGWAHSGQRAACQVPSSRGLVIIRSRRGKESRPVAIRLRPALNHATSAISGLAPECGKLNYDRASSSPDRSRLATSPLCQTMQHPSSLPSSRRDALARAESTQQKVRSPLYTRTLVPYTDCVPCCCGTFWPLARRRGEDISACQPPASRH